MPHAHPPVSAMWFNRRLSAHPRPPSHPARWAMAAALLGSLAACSQPTPPLEQPIPPPAADLAMAPDLAMGPPDLLPAPAPMYLNGSFDGGSSPFQSWVATMEFARE